MKLLKPLLVAGIAFWAISSPARGLSLIAANFDAKNKAERVKVAREVLSEVERLANLIQSPRPSETAWVEAEKSEISNIKDVEASNARFSQLLRAPEFQQIHVHKHLQELRDALLCVVTNPPTLRREMFCWAVASYLLDEPDVFSYGIKVLVDAKRLPEDLPKKLALDSIDTVQVKSRMFARRIQEYISFPYLRGEIVK